MSTSDLPPYRVWSRFKSIKKDGTVLNLRIQDAPSTLLEDVIEFLIKYFSCDETIQKAADINCNQAALDEYRECIFDASKTWSIVICCHDNDSVTANKILGVSAVHLAKENESFEGPQCQTTEMQTLFKIIMELSKIVKTVKNEFDIFHDGRGIIVHPDYRGFGIASEFVKVRRLMINEQNIPVTCAWMTSYGSQRAAAKDNWETLLEVTTEGLGQRCGVVFKDAPTTFKYMIARANKDSSP